MKQEMPSWFDQKLARINEPDDYEEQAITNDQTIEFLKIVIATLSMNMHLPEPEVMSGHAHVIQLSWENIGFLLKTFPNKSSLVTIFFPKQAIQTFLWEEDADINTLMSTASEYFQN
jgi:hypothetical protein